MKNRIDIRILIGLTFPHLESVSLGTWGQVRDSEMHNQGGRYPDPR